MGVQLDCVDDADDGGVDGAVFAFGCEAGGAAGDDEDRFAEAGVNGIDGDQIAGFVGAFRVDGLHDEQFFAFKARVFASANDGADDASEKHFLE
jgi:hypothetical protein